MKNRISLATMVVAVCGHWYTACSAVSRFRQKMLLTGSFAYTT